MGIFDIFSREKRQAKKEAKAAEAERRTELVQAAINGEASFDDYIDALKLCDEYKRALLKNKEVRFFSRTILLAPAIVCGLLFLKSLFIDANLNEAPAYGFYTAISLGVYVGLENIDYTKDKEIDENIKHIKKIGETILDNNPEFLGPDYWSDVSERETLSKANKPESWNKGDMAFGKKEWEDLGKHAF